jgi:hypothetical protein
MDLKGKKAFCFIALKHHGRFLFPITRALAARGMEVLYPTAQAESPFEITMLDEGLPYHHTFSYLTPEVADEIERAYREVRGQWKERFLENDILHHFTLSIQDKALRMHLENFYLLRRMFEVEKPDLVLALHELNSWGKMLGYLCNELRIPFITLQEGLYWGPTGVYRYHTEYSTACFAWGESAREVLVRSGSSADKIYLVGNTHLPAAIREATEPEAMKQTRRRLKLDHKTRVVTVLMGGLGYGSDFEFPKPLLDWARRRKDLTLIFKWHPFNNKRIIDQIGERLAGFRNIRSLQQDDTYRLLAVSDVCAVFGNSTAGLEALAFGKPLVEIRVPGQHYSFTSLGVADQAGDLPDLPEVAESILQKGVSQERREKVEQYLVRNLHSLGGENMERTLDLIQQMLETREEVNKRAPAARRNSSHVPSAKKPGGEEFLCSIVIPFTSMEGVAESLIGVAQHTSADISYECLLAGAGDESRALQDFVQGDVRSIPSSSTSIATLLNLAAREARGRYLCILPPGLIPQPGWLEALVEEMERDPATGIVGGKIIDPQGMIHHAGIAFDMNFSPSSLYQLLPASLPGAAKRRAMRAVSGCLLACRELFLALGGIDEGYTAGLHDIDFCLQAEAAGWKTVYTPESVLVAPGAEPEREESDRLRFYVKWIGSLWPDVQQYWQDDGLDHKQITGLYEKLLAETKVSSAVADSISEQP